MHLDIEYLVKNLTLEEKAGLCSGADTWRSKAVERLGIPAIMVSDGPSGLRKQDEIAEHVGLKGSVKAVAFPTGSAIAATFNRDLMKKLGDNLGKAAKAEGLHTLLGPAINMKRSPLCGRNFEYMSEDPYVAGELATAYTEGVQKHNVGVCGKHFAANNQEFNRMSTNVVTDERTLREIYLPAFEKMVRKGKAWSLMCSYNRINGTYSSDNEWLLDKVLRKDWGFDGIVMTDWGAMNDRIVAMKAGLEFEMPSSSGIRDRQIVKAVKEGRLSMEILDREVRRMLEWIDKGLQEDPDTSAYDKDQQHDVAVEVAKECGILLKNDKGLLPLDAGKKILFVGSFAKTTRYQGGGSSHVNAYHVTHVLECAKSYADVSFEMGWNENGEERDEALLVSAVSKAKSADTVVVFAGLPDSYESEGFDRSHMHLPPCQNELITKLLEVNRNVVVVLFNGSPVEMPWVKDVSSILEMNLAGEGVGEATNALLFGAANPSGHLAETYPIRIEDSPCYPWFPGNGKVSPYKEGVYIGYRWYDTKKLDVLFPFGHGLSYTDFAVENLVVEKTGERSASVRALIRNVGTRSGKAVLQLYVVPPTGGTDRPYHELKEFSKVDLLPGEEKEISFLLDERAFSYFEERIGNWYASSGDYQIEVGFSSRDIRKSASIAIKSEPLPFVFDYTTTIKDIVDAGLAPKVQDIIDALFKAYGVGEEDDGGEESIMNEQATQSICIETPVHSLCSYIEIGDDYIEEIARRLKG